MRVKTIFKTPIQNIGPVSTWIEKGSAAMLTSIQSAGVTPEVNLRITCLRKHAKSDPPKL